jgi:hypothetical protein
MICQRAYGGSARDCTCRLQNLGGWAECPPEARRVLPKMARQPSLSGDFCQDCHSPRMIRAGTCLLCLDCGSTSGGCG